jgi:hypothetical protein
MADAIRRAGASLIMVGAVAWALAACAAAGPVPLTASTAAGSTAAGTAAGSGPGAAEVAAFNARARQVVAQWDRSPLRAAWHDGLVLTDPSELITIPADDGFTSQHQKDALYSGHFALGAALPSAPLRGRVTWPGGGVTVPLLTARAAFRQLATNKPCANGPCGHFTVTGAKPGTVALLTNRGSVTVPAWVFTVAGPPYTVTEAALAPGSYALLPQSVPPGGFGEAGLAAVSADGRVLTITYLTGSCISGSGGLVYASATAVVLGAWAHTSNTNRGCPADALVRYATVRLAAPLAARAVLDAGTGEPLAPSGPARVGG